MELVKLTEGLIVALAVNKDMVAVKEYPTDDGTIMIQVFVAEDDMSRVIGKDGKIINAVRTLVQASSYIKDNKTVKINVDSI